MVAMGLLNEQPHKLEEYVTLKFEMQTFEKRFARATVLTEKLELQSQWEKYCAMEPMYEKASTTVALSFWSTSHATFCRSCPSPAHLPTGPLASNFHSE